MKLESGLAMEWNGMENRMEGKFQHGISNC